MGGSTKSEAIPCSVTMLKEGAMGGSWTGSTRTVARVSAEQAPLSSHTRKENSSSPLRFCAGTKRMEVLSTWAVPSADSPVMTRLWRSPGLASCSGTGTHGEGVSSVVAMATGEALGGALSTSIFTATCAGVEHVVTGSHTRTRKLSSAVDLGRGR